ncbi:protein PLANT CADMIUM RESISTANCE 12-like [Tripterygium wilfordii]|uniref:protein PLANT CADMIUM RESISTANCE 12-like n=1 Tax=Tripterygium wilfordii TaxID=458696 RepID=UPI0018F817FF|nr:protein PLANT CADMIUM RESISTANCE 12-like [Tripterygium wilfordii]
MCVFFVLENMLCGCLYSCMNRSKLRSHFSLPDAPCADFLVHCFCSRCALCQEHRELKNRGIDPSRGWEANVERWNREQITPPIVLPGMSRLELRNS